MPYFLLQAGEVATEATEQAATGGGMSMLLMFGLMFVVLYFFMIRPQQKKQKEHQQMLAGIKMHDVVMTSSGIVGKIVALKNDKGTVVLRVDDATGTKIEFQKQAVVSVMNESNEEETA
ncbi:MAG: preprotein translocase subunit YajC [Candidatus Cloacimonetes bacterium]|nr:preprotein translocase subunit YajC [Candidatus Cloacimonadota bacterium]